MAETLNIKIRVEQTGGGSGAGGASVNNKQAKENAKTAFSVNKAMSVAKQLGTQVANGAIRQIGLRTGNYALQEQAQSALGLVQKGVSIATAFIANPILGTVALIGEGINFATELYRYGEEIKWQNAEAEQLARRAGYLSNSNRSR